MSMDDLLIAIIAAGFGFSVAYIRAELVLHRQMTAAERWRELVQRRSYARRAGIEQSDVSIRPRTVSSSLRTGLADSEGFGARITHFFTGTQI
jgi:hypothetical protein